MVLGEGEISQPFGSIRLVGGESLVSQRTVFSRDSKILFCSCGRRIRVYSTATGDLVRELRGHVTDVTDFKINPRNHLQLVSCALNGEIIYWDYTDGQILKKYSIPGLVIGMLLHPARNDSIILIRKNPTQDDRRKKKGDKKDKNQKRKETEVENCSVGVFNTRDYKEGSKPKLSVFLKKSGNSKQTAINGEGDLLASVKGENLHLWNFTSEKLNTFTYRHARFTCASFHPSDACVAAGDREGRIILWQGVDQLESPITMALHWHPHPLGDVVFSHDGSTILSVGEEGVLVQWQYKTHHQQFLPRLGAPIYHVAINQDDSLTAISQKDNVIRLISNVENGVKRTIQGLRQINNLYLGISFDPCSKALVTESIPGVLQFYLPTTDHHAFSLDVVRQNHIPHRPRKAPLVYTRIDHAAFSDDGSWLATVERRDDKKNALELRLKFWEYENDSQSYVPNTCVDPPHDKKIVAVQFQPQQRNGSSLGPLAMTAGRDGKFKIWILAEEKAIKGEKYSWSCRSVGYYGDKPCQDAAFSQDGSLLAVAYDQTITLWSPETNELRKTLTLPYPDDEVKRIKFGTNSSSQYLISVTSQYLTVWNLISCSVWWSVEAPVSCLATDPHTNLFCAFVAFNRKKSHLYIFDPACPRPVAVQPCVSKKTDIMCAAFDPASVVCSGTQDEKITMSKLYFLTQKQELFTLDFGEPTSEENNSALQASVAGPSDQQSEFLKIFGQPVPSKDESTSMNRGGKGVKGTPSTAVVKQMIQTPSHVLPSVTSLCSSFLQSFLVSKHTPQREEQDDDDNEASESEDEAMEVHEDDSDSETMRTTEGVLEKLDSDATQTERQQLNDTDNSYLDSVDFSWLKDYFK